MYAFYFYLYACIINYETMKKHLLAPALALFTSTVFAQDIKLPAPDMKQQSMTVLEALENRHSVRSFDASKGLTEQQLSNLCWAACGVVRGGDFRTAPTAINRQEIRLFAFTKAGVYEYDAKANTLVKKADGDHRKLLTSNGGNGGFSQDYVMDAPVSLLMVIDFDIFGSQNEGSLMMGCVDAGNVSENINLYCQAAGLATVPRATHDEEGIRKLLGFTDKQLPIMNNPVGYEKK